MRWPVVAALCGSLLVAGNAEAAEFRTQVLVDVDGTPQSGCALPGSSTLADLRLVALSNRVEIVETRVESCRDGDWQLEHGDSTPRAVGFGEGIQGSDALRWSVPRRALGDRTELSLGLVVERLDQPASDRLDASGAALLLGLPPLEPAQSIPTLGVGMGVLLGALLLLWARGSLAGTRSLVAPVAGLALGVAAIVALPDVVQADQPSDTAVLATDALNDTGDAAVDIARLQASVVDDRIALQVDLNNVEDDGLANGAKLLFIGNSLTYVNDLPGMLIAIARQAGKRLTADTIAMPNAALEDHFLQRTAHSALASGQYTLVVMQQGPSSLPESRLHLRRWTRQFEPLIRAGGARPALYMVWPDLSRFDYFDDVRASYSAAANAVNGMFIPAGQAWLAAWSLAPRVELYSSDDFHPSELGTYVAALSMFCEMYRQSPVGLPARLPLDGGHVLDIEPALALQLQAAAWTTHLDHGRPGE